MHHLKLDSPTPRAAIAADAPATVAAAREVAEQGGNAVDIVVAAALAATLAEALMCSLGGSGFLMLRRADGGMELIDGADVVPSGDRRQGQAWTVDIPYGEGIRLRAGPASVAVPGLLHCLETAWRRHGRLPWETLVAPALSLARRGCPVGVTTARWLALAGERLFSRQDASRGCFLPAGRPLRTGERLELPGMADSLALIAREGAAALYGGALGARWADCLAECGGLVTLADLQSYRAQVRTPLLLETAGFQLALNPAPAVGGEALAQLIRSLEGSLIAQATVASAAWVRAQLQAQQRLLHWRRRQRRWLRGPGSTTQISVVTGEGELASLTLSNGYGSGITIPGTGIACNNSLGEPELNPRGFLRAPVGSRLISNMAPCVARHADGRLLAFGSPGASRITTALAQFWSGYALAGLDPQQAMALPRLHLDQSDPAGNADDGATDGNEPTQTVLLCEPGLALEEAGLLRRQRWHLQRFDQLDMVFGGIKLALRQADGSLLALADQRRQGSVAVIG